MSVVSNQSNGIKKYFSDIVNNEAVRKGAKIALGAGLVAFGVYQGVKYSLNYLENGHVKNQAKLILSNTFQTTLDHTCKINDRTVICTNKEIPQVDYKATIQIDVQDISGLSRHIGNLKRLFGSQDPIVDDVSIKISDLHNRCRVYEGGIRNGLFDGKGLYMDCFQQKHRQETFPTLWTYQGTFHDGASFSGERSTPVEPEAQVSIESIIAAGDFKISNHSFVPNGKINVYLDKYLPKASRTYTGFGTFTDGKAGCAYEVILYIAKDVTRLFTGKLNKDNTCSEACIQYRDMGYREKGANTGGPAIEESCEVPAYL